MAHGANLVLTEELRENALHYLAVLEDVTHATRAPAIVLQDEVIAVPIANEIAPANMDVNVPGEIEADQLRPVMLRALDYLLGNDAVLQDPLLVVEVLQEEVQSGDSLDQPALDVLPLTGRYDARDRVEREDALGSLIVIV